MQFVDSLRNIDGLIWHQKIVLFVESFEHCTLIIRDSKWDQQILWTVIRWCDAWVRYVGVLGTVYVKLAYTGDIIFSARVFKFENSCTCCDSSCTIFLYYY